jgi:hypothetical protein
MMTSIRGSFLALIAIELFLTVLPTGADVGPLQMFKGGGVVAPQSEHHSIRLESQQVIIRLKERSYAVDVDFNLFNTGETITEWIGFPKWVASRTASYPTFIRFEGSVNGKQIKFNEEWDLSGGARLRWNMSNQEFGHLAGRPMKEEWQWLVSQVTFPGHARTAIRVTYEAPYYGKGFYEGSYIYGTGSLWKDNIGKAVFIIDSTEVGGTEKISTYLQGLDARPISKNVLRYEQIDFKPHFEAHLKIKLNEWLGLRKADYVRMRKVVGPVPTDLPSQTIKVKKGLSLPEQDSVPPQKLDRDVPLPPSSKESPVDR